MSFPKYPEYKDSSVEWLEEVPAHWVIAPLRWYATIQGGVAKGKSYSDDTPTVDLPYLRVANVQDGHVDLSSVNTVTVALSEVDRYRLKPGDVLMNEGGDNDKLGRGTVWEGEIADCLHQNHVFAIRPNHHLLPYWLSMFTRSSAARSYFYLYSKQSTNLASISSSNVMSCTLPLPPQEEQRQVLRFLEHETARIDALVEEQQRLIELLKEKRQAVISHAVTKGQDPDAPMKGSGVEWLGEVPAHWDIFPIKRDLEFLTSGSRGWASHYSDDGAAFIRIGNLTRDHINLDLSDLQRVSVPEGSEGERTKVKEHDLLFSITAYLGSVAVVPEELETAYVSQHIALARLFKERLLPRWVAYVTLSDVGKNYLSSQGYGGTKVQLSLEDVAELLVTAPPLDEQAAITSFLDNETARIDALAEEGGAVIKLLQERRSALISAAVSGKIDVRGWRPPAGSLAPETTQAEAV